MGHRFNLKHGAIVRSFHLSESIFVLTYSCPSCWTHGIIVGVRGTVLYEVKVGNKTWIRHFNQLRPGVSTQQVDPLQIGLQLGILLDSFGLKQHNQQNIERTPGQEARLPPEPSLRISIS